MKQRFCSTLRKITLILIVVAGFQQAVAQYYYNDLLLPQQNNDLALYRANKVKKVNIVSLNARNEPLEDFSCLVVPDLNYSSTRMISRSGYTGASTLTSWYNGEGLLEKTIDSSAESTTTYTYKYNSDKQLTEVNNTSVSRDKKSRQDEKHIWMYTNDHPEKMLHIRSGGDTLTVIFVLDENKKVVEEITRANNRQTDRVYYYYDDAGRLTDIVRYNNRLQRLIPDFMFEYNEAGQLVQLVSVTRGSSDYLTWKYSYLSNGLKAEETCFNKQKMLIGRMKFEYSY